MTKENLATQLKHYRFRHDYTQKRMAGLIGVSIRTIQRAEYGQAISEASLFKINEAISPKEKAIA